MPTLFFVINSQGEEEPFSFKKVYQSARKVGASKFLAKKIAETIEGEAYPGMKTAEIYKRVKELLEREVPGAAMRYSLKKGMRRLGPTGFPFEKYIGEILLKNGFMVKLNQHIPGLCCRYEIDFLAEKDNLFYIGECKYHNLPGERVHLNVALANYARFLDITNGSFFKNLKTKSLLVTNTKFTAEVIQYSKCVDVKILGWNYPRDKGLEYLIDSQKLYPVTILPSFKGRLVDVFSKKRMMLAQDVLKIQAKKFARKNKISEEELMSLVKEAEILLK